MSNSSTTKVLPLGSGSYYNTSQHSHYQDPNHHYPPNGNPYALPHPSSGQTANGMNGVNVEVMPAASGSAALAPPIQQTSRGTGRRPKRPVDWEKFFGNRAPSEIIVIDDSPEPQPNIVKKRGAAAMTMQQQQTSSNRYSDKKRKTGLHYDPVYPSHEAPSVMGNGYGSPTVTAASSTAGRNSSALISTAPTSAGTSGIAGPSTFTHPATNGAKRQRMTRSTAAAAMAAATGDAFALYHPPPKPPIKAKDVYVQQIPDVRTLLEAYLLYPNLIKLTIHSTSVLDRDRRLMMMMVTTSSILKMI